MTPNKCVYLYKPLDGPAVVYYYDKTKQNVEQNIEYTKSPNENGNSYIYNKKAQQLHHINLKTQTPL